MRKILEIIVHCTATFPDQRVTVADITRWHKQRGWKTIGYHYVVDQDGNVFPGRPLEQAGAHAQGQPADTRTDAQKAALLGLLTDLKQRFPEAVIHGHRDFAKKACPCFDATSEYAAL